ncbi:ankyrin repeat-containing domain protein [Usnea florida]
MPAQSAKPPSEEEWDTQKPRLKKLWLDENTPLPGQNGVMNIMRTKHNFVASKYHYEKHFKHWKWSKNQKSEHWEKALALIQQRNRQGKDTDVLVDGVLVSRNKIRKELSRHSKALSQQLLTASIRDLPKNITIRSPIIDRTDSLMMGLPFGELESLLRLTKNFCDSGSLGLSVLSPSPPPSFPALITYDDTESEDWYLDGNLSSIEEVDLLMQQPSMSAVSRIQIASDVGRYGSSVFAALKSILPKRIADEKILPTSRLLASSDKVFKSPLHRQILFSVANNFAGLGAFPIGDIMHFLQTETTEKLYQMVRSAPGSASRAIIQNIFKAAIEAGDAMIVDLLIRENPIDTQINEQFLVAEDVRYTPVERATALRHEHVVRVLVHHGEDVNKTDPQKERDIWNLRGALDHAVCSVGDDGSYLDIHPQLCFMLLEAGGDLSRGPMQTLLEEEQGELVERIMSENSHKETTEWGNIVTLHYVILYLDDQRAMRIATTMWRLGVDPNEELPGQPHDEPRTIIDHAARRGSSSLVDFLLDSGARLTDDTLLAAVTSGNKDLIEFLISRGADVNSVDRFGMTPLAAAILIQSAEIINMLETCGASPLKHFASVFGAASEVGDLQLIERLVELKGNISPHDLGYALTVALKDGREEIAQILINAGADVNVQYKDEWGPGAVALFYALERRNEALIYSLLDADAVINYHRNLFHSASAIQLATMWANRSMVEALIFAGADLNHTSYKQPTALAIAVKQHNSELVQLLLASGAEVNSSGYEKDCGTALQAAASNGDIKMARYLLDQGADPNDSCALVEAAYRDKNLFELILERYYARYPTCRGKLGATLLARFIEDGDESLVRQMLGMGVNDDAATIWDESNGVRRTAFGFAISRQQDNKDNFLEMFLQKGCNPNSVVVFRAGVFEWDVLQPLITAFLAAIDTQSPSIVELFIEYEADVNFPARLGVKRTPLQRASELGNLDIVNILVDRGADVNAPAAARGGGTALQLAVKGCYIPVACRLLSLGADVNAPGSTANGRTALEAAAEHGRLDMVQILFNAGAAARRSDRGQITNAIALAKDNGHFGVCDLLEAHGKRLERLDEGVVEDVTGSSLDDDPLSL